MQKTRAISLFLLIGCLLLSCFAFINQGHAVAWLDSYGYSKSHVLTYASGAGTAYQVLIKVYKGSGTDGTETVDGLTAGKVYCNGHCRDDFADIRFTDNDQTTILPCWQKTVTSGTSAVFWLKVGDDLSSQNQTIYVYYGKSDATSNSNGPYTFRLFDDFSDNSLNASLWDIQTGSGSVVESGTTLVITAGTSDNNHKCVTSDVTYAVGVAVEMNVKITNTVGAYEWAGMSTVPNTPTGKYLTCGFNARGTVSTFRWQTGDDTNANIVAYVMAKDAEYHVSRTARTGTDDRLFINSEENSGVEYPTATNRYVTFDAYTSSTGGAASITVDWVAVRKFVNPEPGHGAWGAEVEFDSNPPTYSDAAHNTTIVAAPCLFSCRMEDDKGLDQWCFGTNNTGSWENETWANFGANPDWANITKTLNSTVGMRVEYCWWFNDTFGNENTTGILFLITISAYPFYSDISYNETKSGAPCLLSCLWTCDIDLDEYVFGHNNTGTWQNKSVPISGLSVWANETIILNSTFGVRVEFMWWCRNIIDFENDTGIHYLITTGLTATLYIMDGGQLQVNGSFVVNGTVLNNIYGTVYVMWAYPDGGKIFQKYEWDGSTTVLNPYNFTLTDDCVFWAYFQISGAGGENAQQLAAAVAACFILFPALILVFVGVRRRK